MPIGARTAPGARGDAGRVVVVAGVAAGLVVAGFASAGFAFAGFAFAGFAVVDAGFDVLDVDGLLVVVAGFAVDAGLVVVAGALEAALVVSRFAAVCACAVDVAIGAVSSTTAIAITHALSCPLFIRSPGSCDQIPLAVAYHNAAGR